MEEEDLKNTASVLSRALQNIKGNRKSQDFVVIQKRLNEEKEKSKPGIVYISHLPKDFNYEVLEQYFSQFGNITRIRLAKSEKTGRSKGYAHIQYEYGVVAKIVAETMNNYIFNNRLIKAEYLGVGYFNREFWKKYNFSSRNYPKLNNRLRNAKDINKKCSALRARRRLRSRLRSLARIVGTIKRKGVDYKYRPDLQTPGKYVVLKEQNVQLQKEKSEKKEKEKKKEKEEAVEANHSLDVHQPVLEVDESDDEIEFMTPPNAIKRKLAVHMSPENMQEVEDGFKPPRKRQKIENRFKSPEKRRESNNEFESQRKTAFSPRKRQKAVDRFKIPGERKKILGGRKSSGKEFKEKSKKPQNLILQTMIDWMRMHTKSSAKDKRKQKNTCKTKLTKKKEVCKTQNLEECKTKESKLINKKKMSGVMKTKKVCIPQKVLKGKTAVSGITKKKNVCIPQKVQKDKTAVSGITKKKKVCIPQKVQKDKTAVSGVMKKKKMCILQKVQKDKTAVSDVKNKKKASNVQNFKKGKTIVSGVRNKKKVCKTKKFVQEGKAK